MRVIAGNARGIKLAFPKDKKIRPTKDIVKESMFNILSDAVPDSKVLDLYCGSGSLGIEALSRGASSCVFVDKDVRYVHKNLKKVKLDAMVIECSVKKAIAILNRKSEKFDIIFADPPYAQVVIKNVLCWLAKSDTLLTSTIILVEYSVKQGLDLETVTTKQYGDTLISVLRKEHLRNLTNR